MGNCLGAQNGNLPQNSNNNKETASSPFTTTNNTQATASKNGEERNKTSKAPTTLTTPQKTKQKSVSGSSSSPPPSSGFVYRKNTCALEYWEPKQLIGEGSISSIHLVQRRERRIDVPYEERADVMRVVTQEQDGTSSSQQQSRRRRQIDPSQPVYALKSIMKDHVSDDTFLQEMRNEIYTMSKLNHPNVIKVFEAYERKRHIYLIMELCRGGDLTDVLQQQPQLSEARAQSIVRKILSAVSYLHAHKVVHRDIKMENIMFVDKSYKEQGEDAVVKLIDFGLATRYLSDEYKSMTDRVGTIYTMAPQVLQGCYDYKCDLWSIGVVAYMLLSGEQPFWGPRKEMPWAERRKIMVDRIMRCQYMRMRGGVWDDVSTEAKMFVKSLLQIDPEKRPSAKKALKSLWMKKKFETEVNEGETQQQQHSLADQISRYSRETKLKRLALTMIAYKMPANDIEELQQRFETYDTEKQGFISLEDFRKALSSSQLSEKDIESIFYEMDLDSTGYLEYKDFIAAALDTRGRVETERIAEAFDRLDTDKKGAITKQNLRSALGENVSDHVLSEILEEVDAQEEGEVTYEKFMELFGRKNAARIHSLSSHDDENDHDESSDEDLVDEKNAVIPGGKNDPECKTKYVYDRKSQSVRKCDSLEV
jgi:calcium-dependent protein kinase